jgi:outer membrane protein
VTFKPTYRSLLLAAAMLAATPALAQDDEPLPNDKNMLTLGIGGAYVPSYEGSDDYVLTPIGIVIGKVGGFGFGTRGTSFYFDVIPSDPNDPVSFDLGPVVNVRLDRTSRIKDAQVRALGELDAAIEIGGFAGITKNRVLHRYDSLSARVTVQKDVSDTHGSTIIIPAVEYTSPVSERALVQLGLQAEHVGDGYGATYFSVTPAGAAASGLPVYATDGGWKNWRLSLFGAHMLTGTLRDPGLALFAGVSYSKLMGGFKRSPIVAIAGDSDQYLVTAGLSYTF